MQLDGHLDLLHFDTLNLKKSCQFQMHVHVYFVQKSTGINM